MRKLLLILFILIPFVLQAQTTYYVSTSGDNGDNGLTELTAWETLDYAESNATTAGDSILLKKGDTWTRSTVLAINEGGSAGTYTVWDGSLWGTGANATILCSSPTGFNSVVQIAACDYLKFQNIIVDVDHENQYGIVIGGFEEDMGPIVQNDERFITIENCSVLDVGDGSVYRIGILAQAVYNDMYNITVTGCTTNYTGAHGVAFYMYRFASPGDRHTLHNGYIGYNTISNAGQAPFAANGIFLNDGIDSCIIEHNAITQGTGACPGIAIAHSDDDPVRQPRKIHIRYNNVRMGDQEALVFYYGGDKSVYTYYNLFYNAGAAGKSTIKIESGDYTGATFTFYNNVIVNMNTTANSFAFLNNDNGDGTTTFRNNIVVSGKTDDELPMMGIYPGGNTIHSYNLYHATLVGAGVYFVQDGDNFYSRSNITTWEATAQEGDPLFDEVVANYDTLWVQAGSEAINNGISVGLIYDYLGNLIDEDPDMGAYEYGAEDPNPPPDPPTMLTSTPSVISTRLVRAGGNVTDDGGGTISTKGLCWSLSVNPTISDTHTTNGSGEGAFSDYITTQANTTYNVRSWAYSDELELYFYGTNVEFTTPVHSSGTFNGSRGKYQSKRAVSH